MTEKDFIELRLQLNSIVTLASFYLTKWHLSFEKVTIA